MNKIYFILLFLVSCNCERPLDKRNIKFINKSNGIVYFIPSRNDYVNNLHAGLDDASKDEIYKTLKDSINTIFDKPNDWDNYIQYSQDGRLRLFVISKDSVDKYGWQKVFDSNIYTKVYKVTIDDLNKLKWTILYTGK